MSGVLPEALSYPSAPGGRPGGHPIGRSVGNGRWAVGVATIQAHGCAAGVRKFGLRHPGEEILPMRDSFLHRSSKFYQ